MNFQTILEELDKLYEDSSSEQVKAKKVIEADKQLSADYAELLPAFENGNLNHSFSCGNLFNVAGDMDKIAIQWVDAEDNDHEKIVDSLEAALVFVKELEANNPLTEATIVTEALNEDADEEILIDNEPIIDDEEATDEEITVDDEPIIDDMSKEVTKQLILECSNCGGLVIKDEADVEVDEASDLANSAEACQYCEESKGYKIIGEVMPYESDETVDNEETDEEVADIAETDEVVETEIESSEETSDDEDLD